MRFVKQFLLLTFFSSATFIISLPLYASVPSEITYTGRLREYNQPVSGTRIMSFKIFDAEQGGNQCWTSGNVDIAVSTGAFSYTLLPSIDWRGRDFWIETTISGKILTPREKITSQVYALHAGAAENIQSTSTISFVIGTATHMTITPDGGIGIGTASPQAKLHIANGGIMFPDGTVQQSALGTGLWLSTGTTIYRQNGNVGILTSTPAHALEVNGTIKSDGLIIDNVDTNELSYLDGVTSPLQPQLISKISKAGDTMTGNLIMNGGSIGVGTATPLQSLHLAAGGIRFSDGSEMNSANIGSAASLSNNLDLVITADADGNSSGDIKLKAGGNDRIVIKNNGYTGIGTATPETHLHVSAANAATAIALDSNSNNATQADIIFRKTRLGGGGGGAILTGDSLGQIKFQAHDGTDLDNTGAAIKTVSEGTITSNRIPASLLFYTQPDSIDPLTERMRITPNGNIGIGADAPDNKLHVCLNIDDDSKILKLENASSGGSAATSMVYKTDADSTYTMLQFAGSNALNLAGINVATMPFRLATITSDPLYLMTNSLTRLTILPDGNVGIGTTSPTSALDVRGLLTVLHADDGSSLFYLGNTGSNQGFDFARNNADGSLRIQGTQTGANNIILAPTSGNVGIGTINPKQVLHIHRASDPAIKLTNDASGSEITDGLYLQQSGLASYILNWENGPLGIGTDGSVDMSIASGGNVGIGTTNPSVKLDVYSSADNVSMYIRTDKSDGSALLQFSNDYWGYLFKCDTDDIFRITDSRNSYNLLTLVGATGNVGIGKDPGTTLDVNGTVNATTIQQGGNELIPSGVIVMWSGSVASIPAGWALCDGGLHSGVQTPDLRDRFIVGAGNTKTPGDTGGTSSHLHGIAHTHAYSGDEGAYQQGSTDFFRLYRTNHETQGASTTNSETQDHIPPYYALAFIMKT